MESKADETHSNSQWSVNDKSRLCNALIALQGKQLPRNILIMKEVNKKKLFQIKTVHCKR